MSPTVPAWLAFSRRVGRVTGMFRTATRPYTAAARSIAAQRTAAEETARRLAERSKRELRYLTVIMVHCTGNELLLRVVRIPDSMPAAAYGRYLVIPRSGVTFRFTDERVPAKAWYLSEEGSFDVQCQCHPRPVTLTPEQVRGVSALPAGIRRTGPVLES